MARVNHKKIKQLIAQKQKTITDRQFFSSRILAAHFADIAAAQTRRYGVKRRIKVNIDWAPKEERTASTDNNLIWINAGHRYVTNYKTRPERYEQVCGAFAHELGHVLYTDFLAAQTYHSRQETGKWYPERPLLRNASERRVEAAIWDYAKSDTKHMQALMRVSHEILNVLEDGYIEQRMLIEYPGILGSCLQARRNGCFKEVPTVSQMVENEPEEGHIWLTTLQNILSYMKWGEIKYGDTPLSDPRIQVVFSMLPDLDQALVSRDFKDRCRAANLILVRCWDNIRDFLDICEERAAKAASEGSSTSGSELAGEIMATLAGHSTESSGKTAPVSGGGSASTSGSPTAKKRIATAKLAQAGSEGEKGSEKETEKETGDDAEHGILPAADSLPEGSDEGEDTAGMGKAGVSRDSEGEQTIDGGGALPPSSCQPVSGTETGRIPLQETAEVSVPEGGDTEQDDEYAGTGYSNAASDIERVLEKIAENDVCTELERQRTKELTELAQSISYGNIHDGVRKVVHRMAEVGDDLKEQYERIADDLLHISKQLQKSITQQLKDSRRGGKQTGLLFGRRLDSHALCRKDGRVFCKNALPNDTPTLSVGLLLDESGSMSSNDRVTYARAAAIILYDFCQALGIPIIVYGHSTGRGSVDKCVDLYAYAEFDAIDRNDRYRMMDISARSNNRDGAALRYVAERLSTRPEDVKLLILVSDGQPADTGYFGTAAEEDLRGIKQEYQRKGILFVAAAIGSDKESIERIYGESYLDITDLYKLPVKLAGVIKRFIRV